MKKFLIIIGAILLAGLIGAGGFWGGMKYQSNQVNQAFANFANARGPANGGGFPNNGFPNNGQDPRTNGGNSGNFPGRGFVGGGTTGQVKSLDGNVLLISTPQNVTTVNLSDSTQIQKAGSATTADLQPGVQVIVTGQRDSNGNIAASQIMILNNTGSGVTSPSTTESAP